MNVVWNFRYTERICLISIQGAIGRVVDVVSELQVDDVVGDGHRGEAVHLTHEPRSLSCARHGQVVSDGKEPVGGHRGAGPHRSGDCLQIARLRSILIYVERIQIGECHRRIRESRNLADGSDSAALHHDQVADLDTARRGNGWRSRTERAVRRDRHGGATGRAGEIQVELPKRKVVVGVNDGDAVVDKRGGSRYGGAGLNSVVVAGNNAVHVVAAGIGIDGQMATAGVTCVLGSAGTSSGGQLNAAGRQSRASQADVLGHNVDGSAHVGLRFSALGHCKGGVHAHLEEASHG